LIEEGHREVAEIEKSCVDRLALLKLLMNPLNRTFRKPTLAGAADDYRDSRHGIRQLFPSSRSA
jgi:hypothetical protein